MLAACTTTKSEAKERVHWLKRCAPTAHYNISSMGTVPIYAWIVLWPVRVGVHLIYVAAARVALCVLVCSDSSVIVQQNLKTTRVESLHIATFGMSLSANSMDCQYAIEFQWI